MKTLIAEDDSLSRTILNEILHPYGECWSVTNGKEAIDEYISAYIEGKPYDLVCLDIMMPEVDGQEALKRIRKFELKKKIMGLDGVKVIMVTALDDKENIFEAFNAQCEGYITKPIDGEKIIAKIKELGLIDQKV